MLMQRARRGSKVPRSQEGHTAMADTLDDGGAESQAAEARARDLKARFEMVLEILKYLGDDDRKRILNGALLKLKSQLRVR
jgi:hypothetical protein